MLEHPHVRFGKPTITGGLTAGVLPSTAEVKEHLRVDFSDDDTYIATLITAVTAYIEDYCGCIFGQATRTAYWDYTYPVVEISSPFESIVTTMTVEGESVSVAPKLSQKNDEGDYVDLASDKYEIDYVQNPVRVHMISGFDATVTLNKFKLTWITEISTLPEYMHTAFLMICGHFYENRQDVGKERIFEVPMNSRYLLERYRQQTFL